MTTIEQRRTNGNGYAEPSILDGIIEATEEQGQQVRRQERIASAEVAHAWPRGLDKSMAKMIAMATYNQAVAEECEYKLPRGGKTISGPGIRLAEIATLCWGNISVETTIVSGNHEGSKCVTVRATARDNESNVEFSSEVPRRTEGRNGQAYNNDMRLIAIAAATSIATRNVIFRIIPRAFIDQVLEEARKVARGEGKGIKVRREEIMGALIKRADSAGYALTKDAILATLKRDSVEDITWDDIDDLIGFGTAVKDGTATWAGIFDAPEDTPEESAEKAAEAKKAEEDAAIERKSYLEMAKGYGLGKAKADAHLQKHGGDVKAALEALEAEKQAGEGGGDQ